MTSFRLSLLGINLRAEQSVSNHEAKPHKPRSAQSRIKSSEISSKTSLVEIVSVNLITLGTSSTNSSQRGSAASFYDTKVMILGRGGAGPTPLSLPSNNMQVSFCRSQNPDYDVRKKYFLISGEASERWC